MDGDQAGHRDTFRAGLGLELGFSFPFCLSLWSPHPSFPHRSFPFIHRDWPTHCHFPLGLALVGLSAWYLCGGERVSPQAGIGGIWRWAPARCPHPVLSP